jgi:hypothetical protein
MNAPIVQPLQATTATGWLLLEFDERRLALPQRDVRQIELVVDLGPATADGSREAGWFVLPDGDSWPAYSFDGALQLQKPAPAGQRICVFIRAGGQPFGLLCNRVSPLHADDDLDIEAVPGCLSRKHSPIAGFALVGSGLALVTNGDALAAYLGSLREQVR